MPVPAAFSTFLPSTSSSTSNFEYRSISFPVESTESFCSLGTRLVFYSPFFSFFFLLFLFLRFHLHSTCPLLPRKFAYFSFDPFSFRVSLFSFDFIFFLTRRYIDVSLSSWKIWCNDIGGRTSLCILTVSFVWRDFSTANWAGSTFYHEVAFVYHTRTQMLLPVYRSKDETKCCALFPFSLKIRSANKETRLARCFLEFTKESRKGEKFAGLCPYSNSTDNETN